LCRCHSLWAAGPQGFTGGPNGRRGDGAFLPAQINRIKANKSEAVERSSVCRNSPAPETPPPTALKTPLGNLETGIRQIGVIFFRILTFLGCDSEMEGAPPRTASSPPRPRCPAPKGFTISPPLPPLTPKFVRPPRESTRPARHLDRSPPVYAVPLGSADFIAELGEKTTPEIQVADD
jgi:hypothetical protein